MTKLLSPEALRREYASRPLEEAAVAAEPIAQFESWFDDAVRAGLTEPNAMTLATATADGRPSARMVLLKGFDARGFVFYTNYESRKGQELAANAWAALVFWWAELARQVRIEGTAARVPEAESDAYFATRPPGSQLGAWVSPQSRVVNGRSFLDEQWAAYKARFAGQPIPRPVYWGGYRLAPVAVEFWQGRTNRLHDRLRYRLVDGGGWIVERLAP